MLAGHYSAAFAIKAAEPRLPLWLLFLAVQFVDILWAPLVLVGIERISLDESLPSNPLVLEHIPWTHSLPAAVFWGIVFSLIVARAWPALAGRAAVLAGVAVFSHWVLDLLVHRPDLAVAPGVVVGLGLWNHPVAAYLLEIVLLSAAFAWCATRMPNYETRIRVMQIGIGLLILQTAVSFGPVPPFIPLITASLLALFLGLAWGAWRFGPENMQPGSEPP